MKKALCAIALTFGLSLCFTASNCSASQDGASNSYDAYVYDVEDDSKESIPEDNTGDNIVEEAEVTAEPLSLEENLVNKGQSLLEANKINLICLLVGFVALYFVVRNKNKFSNEK